MWDLLFTDDRVVDAVEDTDTFELFKAFLSRILEYISLLLEPCQVFSHSDIRMVHQIGELWHQSLIYKLFALAFQVRYDRIDLLVDSLFLEPENVVNAELICPHIEVLELLHVIELLSEANSDQLLLCLEFGSINFALLETVSYA